MSQGCLLLQSVVHLQREWGKDRVQLMIAMVMLLLVSGGCSGKHDGFFWGFLVASVRQWLSWWPWQWGKGQYISALAFSKVAWIASIWWKDILYFISDIVIFLWGSFFVGIFLVGIPSVMQCLIDHWPRSLGLFHPFSQQCTLAWLLQEFRHSTKSQPGACEMVQIQCCCVLNWYMLLLWKEEGLTGCPADN